MEDDLALEDPTDMEYADENLMELEPLEEGVLDLPCLPDFPVQLKLRL